MSEDSEFNLEILTDYSFNYTDEKFQYWNGDDIDTSLSEFEVKKIDNLIFLIKFDSLLPCSVCVFNILNIEVKFKS